MTVILWTYIALYFHKFYFCLAVCSADCAIKVLSIHLSIHLSIYLIYLIYLPVSLVVYTVIYFSLIYWLFCSQKSCSWKPADLSYPPNAFAVRAPAASARIHRQKSRVPLSCDNYCRLCSDLVTASVHYYPISKWLTLSSTALELGLTCLHTIINCTNDRSSLDVFFVLAIDMFCYVLHFVSHFQSATIILSTLIGWRLSVLINDMLCLYLFSKSDPHKIWRDRAEITDDSWF